jgi:hypothetical protein
MFGYDGADYRVVKVDASGNLVAVILADQNVQARGYGWINAAWQKQPMPIGFSAVLSKDTYNPNLVAGQNFLVLPTVPAGEVWVYTNIIFYYIGTVATVQLVAQNVDGVNNPYLFGVGPPVSAQIYDRQGQWFLGPGSYIRLIVNNATAGDDAEIGATGFAFDIDQ